MTPRKFRHRRRFTEAHSPGAATQLPLTADADDGAAVAQALDSLSSLECPQFHEGFDRVEAEIIAVPREQLVPVNIGIPGVITTILGVYPRILALREELAKLGHFDIKLVDRLQDFALALGHVYTLNNRTIAASDDLAALAKEGIALRDRLRTDIATLIKRGCLAPEYHRKLQNGIGYHSIAFDLHAIAGVLMEAMPKLQGKVLFTTEELHRARVLSSRMLPLIGRRERKPAGKKGVALLLQQAPTLCLSAYNEVRQAIQFLRRHAKDGDKIAPSLFLVRGRRRSRARADETPGDTLVSQSNVPANDVVASQLAQAVEEPSNETMVAISLRALNTLVLQNEHRPHAAGSSAAPTP